MDVAAGPADPDWNVAMVLHRESTSDTLKALQAILRACSRPIRVDLLVNGQPALAAALQQQLEANPLPQVPLHVNVWSMAFGDKAHAWNEYIHGIWPGAGHAFFVDGYARVRPDSMGRLAGALSDGQALAASGVPTVGHGAAALTRQMLSEGGLHGNLFVVSGATMGRLREMRFRLPLGLYRTDATLGAALSFGLEPGLGRWEPQRHIRVVAEATWDIDQPPWWRAAALSAQWKRRERQAQGRLENRAVRYCFAERGQAIGSLPKTAPELVKQWANERPEEWRRLLASSPRVAWAWHRLQQGRDFSRASISTELVHRRPPAG